MYRNDYIYVTNGTGTAEMMGFIGQILQILNDPTSENDTLPYRVRFNGYTCWVNGVRPTDLLKALL